MKILVTGGCGFVGTVLTEKLLADGHEVIVVDSQWFGSYLVANSRLTVVKMDIRDTDALPLTEVEAIVHLANIANDPAVELNPELSWEVNVLAGQQLADFAVRAGVRHFIYASSGSVYGVQEEEQVTEDLALVPISAYNKTKMVAERVFLSYQEDMRVHCIRPATVCGVSPRMRLDVSVNMFTHQALSTGRITVFGGDQTRPNIHIDDMVDVYRHFIDRPELESGCYNAGFENLSIKEIADRVRSVVPSEVVISESDDPRSYRQNSDKLLATGFCPHGGVDKAIADIAMANSQGLLLADDSCYTVRQMKALGLAGTSRRDS